MIRGGIDLRSFRLTRLRRGPRNRGLNRGAGKRQPRRLSFGDSGDGGEVGDGGGGRGGGEGGGGGCCAAEPQYAWSHPLGFGSWYMCVMLCPPSYEQTHTLMYLEVSQDLLTDPPGQ